MTQFIGISDVGDPRPEDRHRAFLAGLADYIGDDFRALAGVREGRPRRDPLAATASSS